MKKGLIILVMVTSGAIAMRFTNDPALISAANLRKIYSRPPGEWPAPFVHDSVKWKELDVLPNPPGPPSPAMVELGKTLFFEPRLSGSTQISCASCHIPSLSWADGREKSLGHEGQLNKRNSPSLHNVWFYKKLFWDGRSHSLEDQAFAPINSESEMHGDMRELPRNLRRIKGYAPLFERAYGDPGIDPDRIAGALAAFQRTIVSRKSRFDEFLEGNTKSLSNSELRGLHIFRTKAQCMNCHHGALFSDNSFHNNGFAGTDPGLYNLTHAETDRGKMKTPSLRDVMNTRPWMHDGKQDELLGIINTYNKAEAIIGRDPLIQPLRLSKSERLDLLAFLTSISSPPLEFNKPSPPD